MLGMIPFVSAAGKAIGKMIKGKTANETLKKEVEEYGLNTEGVDISVDDEGVVTLSGKATTQEEKEKIILAVGNVEGVGGVKDEASTIMGGRESQFHTVVSGDSLSAISKKYYGTWKQSSKPISRCCQILIKFTRDKFYVFPRSILLLLKKTEAGLSGRES